MSITDPTQIIRLITGLSEQLASWNIRVGESFRHAEAVHDEHTEVTRMAEKDWLRAVDTAEKDAEAIAGARSVATVLFERSSDLFEQTDRLREEAGRRSQRAEESRAYWKECEKKGRDWHEVAEKEYERAVEEYNQAVDEYNEAVAELKRAEEKLQDCRSRQTTDRQGRTSPSCDSQYHTYRKWEEECKKRLAIVEERKATLEEAELQRDRAGQALELAVKGYREAMALSDQAKDLLSMSNVAYRSASDAVSASRSALFMVDKSEEKNRRQQALNDESRLCYGRITDAAQTIGAALASIGDLSENGNRLNALLASELEYKSSLLYRLSNLTAADLPVFDSKN